MTQDQHGRLAGRKLAADIERRRGSGCAAHGRAGLCEELLGVLRLGEDSGGRPGIAAPRPRVVADLWMSQPGEFSLTAISPSGASA
jgi:hypothetical protein